jgi:enterochelin esterase-like enzyme
MAWSRLTGGARRRAIALTAAGLIAVVLAVALTTHAGDATARHRAVAFRATPTPPSVPAGTLRRVTFASRALGRRASFQIYLPAGYGAAAARGHRYPVLYLLHPPRGRPDDYVTRGDLDYAADTLIAGHQMRPMLLVIPDGRTSRFGDDTEWANADAGHYQDFVVEVVHRVDAQFATRADRAHRGIAGLSEGGYGALNIGLHRLDLFSVVQSWSGYFVQTPTTAFDGASRAMLAANSPADYVAGLAPSIRAVGLRAFLYQGEHDQEHAENLAAFSAQLARAGAEVHWGYFPGGHGWGLWRRQTPRMLRAASAWFSRSPRQAHAGALTRLGGQAAPWSSYYHYRGTKS